MIIQNIYLEDWDWTVKVFYAVSTYYLDEIIGELECIGCTGRELRKAERTLGTGRNNIGLTYSNLQGKCSVVVIGLTSSPAEFQNTFDHEKMHLAMHISQACKVDPFSEDFAYLVGDIGLALFPIAKKFICEHCLEKIKGEDSPF